MPISEQQVVLYAQVAGQLIPIIATTVASLKTIFAQHDVDPGVYARIDAAYRDREIQARAEAAAHGHPVIDPLT